MLLVGVEIMCCVMTGSILREALQIDFLRFLATKWYFQKKKVIFHPLNRHITNMPTIYTQEYRSPSIGGAWNIYHKFERCKRDSASELETFTVKFYLLILLVETIDLQAHMRLVSFHISEKWLNKSLSHCAHGERWAKIRKREHSSVFWLTELNHNNSYVY